METNIRIRGKRWRLILADGLRSKYGVWGDCDHPTTRSKAIRLEPNQTPEQMMDTLFHEYRHAANPELSEEAVREDAKDLSRAVKALQSLIERRADELVSGNFGGLSAAESDREKELGTFADPGSQGPSVRGTGCVQGWPAEGVGS